MTRSSSNKNKVDAYARRYRSALRRYFKQDGRTKPVAAARLGRDAVALAMETLDVALIHEQALMDEAISTTSAAARDRLVRRARKFFAEAILPIEETHRTAMQQNAELIRLNQEMDQQTRSLSASNQKLKREIARRKVVEQSLRESERDAGEHLDKSQRLQEELRHLSRGILSGQEEERKRISRELHDLVAQILVGIHVHLATLKTEAAQNTTGLTENIERTQKIVEESVDKVHRFARDLRPAVLDDLGLIPALHSFLKRFGEETGLHVKLTAFAGVEKVNNATRTVLYRVAQEALTNVARHANAERVAVQIMQLPNAIRMQIKDDGRSFDVERLMHSRKNKRMGLLGMRERVEMVGGAFAVESLPGSGTTVIALIPFRNGAKERTR